MKNITRGLAGAFLSLASPWRTRWAADLLGSMRSQTRKISRINPDLWSWRPSWDPAELTPWPNLKKISNCHWLSNPTAADCNTRDLDAAQPSQPGTGILRGELLPPEARHLPANTWQCLEKHCPGASFLHSSLLTVPLYRMGSIQPEMRKQSRNDLLHFVICQPFWLYIF